MKPYSSWINRRRASTYQNFQQGLAYQGQKLQKFMLSLRNSGGVIQHKLVGDQNFDLTNPDPTPMFGDRIFRDGPRVLNWVNTPTLSGSVEFANGGGIYTGATDRFVFDTLDQQQPLQIALVDIAYYSGNVTRARPWLAFVSRDVNGRVWRRLEMRMTLQQTGAVWNFSTTNIPSGTFLFIDILAALA